MLPQINLLKNLKIAIKYFGQQTIYIIDAKEDNQQRDIPRGRFVIINKSLFIHQQSKAPERTRGSSSKEELLCLIHSPAVTL